MKGAEEAAAMESSSLLAELPAAVRELVIGHWPRTDADGMRRNGDAYEQTGGGLDDSADRYEAAAKRAERSVEGATAVGLAERHRVIAKSMRDQAAVCRSLGEQCHDVADSTVQTQHLLIAVGVALAAQLAYDALLFFQGGGAKAVLDRIEAEQAMRAATARLATAVGERAIAGAGQRAALHGAVHAAKIGLGTSAAISGGAQLWDLASGVRDEFDLAAFSEMLAGGLVGGVAGAEVGRRLAPRVLNRTTGRAVTRSGRFSAHIGGTMVIGGAGGLAGGVFGALPSVLIHSGDIHSLGDLFKMVRASAITGFGSGFVGAAGNALRVHRAGVQASRGGRDATGTDDVLSEVVARHRAFAARVDELVTSGEQPRVEEIERFSTAGKSAKVVERLTFQDGTELIRKIVSDPSHAHAEFLSSLVAGAVGARVPTVHVSGNQVYMEVVPGKVAAETYARGMYPEAVFDSPGGRRLGLFDAVLRIPDRNGDNWMIDPEGNVWGIDNSRAFEDVPDTRYVISPFAEHFQGYGADNKVVWKDHALTRTEVQEIRQRVERLSPVFSAAGRRGWHDLMLQHLHAVEPHAVISPPRNDNPGRLDASVRHGLPQAPAPPRNVDVSATPERPFRMPPRVEPHNNRSSDDGSDALPAPDPGQTAIFRHPDGGYVDVVLTGRDGAGVPVRLVPGQEYILGRGSGALLADVATDGVSRRHATVEVNEHGHVFIRDDNSLNGTFVDGKQLVGGSWVRIHDGQELLLGRDVHVGVTFQRQMAQVRLFGNDGPVLTLHRGREIAIGRGMVHPDAPQRHSMSTRHGVIGMDEDGRVWIRDDSSENGIRVNKDRLADGQRRTLEPGDRVEFGRYLGEAQFLPPNAVIEAGPVHVQLGGGPAAMAVRLRPGESVVIGTGRNSPFADQLRGVSGVSSQHATLGLDYDGRLWIRDHRGSDGVWVNGDRIAANQRVTLAAGDNVGLGPEFVGIARVAGDEYTRLPPAELLYAPYERRPPIRLEPGREVLIDVSALNNHAIVLSGDLTGHQVVVGRDLDGRIWVRDPNSFSHIRVNDEAVAPGEKRYLNADDTVNFDNVAVRLQVGEEAPLILRLSDDDGVPPLTLRRGEAVLIGRNPESPMAGNLADHLTVSRRHAVIYRDEAGNVWLRDEHSRTGTWVENVRVDRNGPPALLRPGDRIRLGEWVGAAVFSDGYHNATPRLLEVKLNSPQGNLSLDLVRAGDPVLLGREGSVLPDGIPHRNRISARHASIGVHPSGRVWIRDEGSTNHTFVNDREINPGTKVTLHPGDRVRLGDVYEFTVAFPPPEGGPFIDILDSTPESIAVLRDHLGRIRHDVFDRVSDYLNAMPDGGIVIGRRPVAQMPGLDALVRDSPDGPNDRVRWENVAGLYTPGSRRIYVDSRAAQNIGSGILIWHEFGHATDYAYGTGGARLSKQAEWQNLHDELIRAVGGQRGWDHYYDQPIESFAEAFAGWVAGPTRLRKFALGNHHIADQLQRYFDRVFTR